MVVVVVDGDGDGDVVDERRRREEGRSARKTDKKKGPWAGGVTLCLAGRIDYR